MTIEERYELSCYQELTKLNDAKNIWLVRHNETGMIYIKKEMHRLGDAEHAADGDGDDVAEDAGNDDHGNGQRHIAAELLRDAHADGGRDGLRQERDVLLMRKTEGEAQRQHAAQRGGRCYRVCHAIVGR